MNPRVPVRLESLGFYLPPAIVRSHDLEQEWGLRSGTLERITGVAERRRETTLTSSAMAVNAARAALAQTAITPGDIDVILGGSAIPQQAIPCMSAFVQEQLGSARGAFCLDVNATCLGFLAALHVASLMLQARPSAVILVYSSEQTSLSLDLRSWESAGLFGDAAAAAIVRGAGPGETSDIDAAHFETYSEGISLATVRGGGTFRHPNDPRTTREDNLFRMEGPALLAFTGQQLALFLEEFLKSAGRRPRDYDAVVPHQASRAGLNLLTRQGFCESQVVSNLRERGNCIAASIPLALAEAVQAGRITRGQRVLLIGSAAGISIGAIDLVF